MNDIENIKYAVIEGDESKVKLHVLEALNGSVKASDIMSLGLVAAMDIVGEKMEAEDIFIPEVLMSANAMSSAAKEVC